MSATIQNIFKVGTSPLSQGYMSDLRKLRDTVVDIGESLNQMQVALHMASNRSMPRPYTAFLCIIGAVQGPFTNGLGATYWQYDWEEVLFDTTTSNYVILSGGRKSNSFSRAINIHEFSVSDDGGNTGNSGAILSRLRIPYGSIVNIHVMASGHCWFDRVNPLDTDCAP
jgi:hypothetical protein